MTNKTITMAREREEFESLVQRKSERFQPYFIRFSDHPEADYKDGTLQWAWELWQARAALADPVPPAGGCLQCWNCKADFTLAERASCDGCCWKCGREIDLDDYVIRLQAEVERLKQENGERYGSMLGLANGVGELKSELTKARELIVSLYTNASPALFSPGQRTAVEAFIANQSAPADKGQGGPVAWIKPDVAKTLAKDECCYAFGSQNPKGTLIPLYAEQPAPVAVVMPDLTELREYHVKAAGELKAYADDSGMRESDVKHYRKRAAVHEAFVAVIDRVKS